MISMACRRARTTATGERGQALLELVLVVPLMLALTFATIDFGRAIWQLEVITGLTREGSNLASRNVTLPKSVAAVISDGAALNLTANGEVIITSVQNQGTASVPSFVMTGQSSTGSLSATSKIGAYNPAGTQAQNKVTLSAESLPGVTTTMPQPGGTIYVTEIFDSFSPITPLGAFVAYTMPTTVHDVAYF